MSHPRIAIIGAGISGLACGQALRSCGVPFSVFEKSRSLGGRLATRRWEGHIVDHGAPWFSHLPPALQEKCQDVIQRLDSPVLDQETGQALTEPEGGRWFLPAGNNRLGKLLADGLDGRLEHLVESLTRTPDGRWELSGESFDAVVLTAPWPQTRRLLAPWLDLPLPNPEPTYPRTLTAFFEYDSNPAGPAAEWSGMEHGADADSGLARSICENHKAGRILSGRTVIVAHGTPAFSEAHFDSDREVWSAALESAVRNSWQLPAGPRAVFTHRWGFSTVQQPFDVAPVPPGLHVAGDAVAGSSISGVFANGWALGQALSAGA
jgi:renalase